LTTIINNDTKLALKISKKIYKDLKAQHLNLKKETFFLKYELKKKIILEQFFEIIHESFKNII